MRCPSCGEVNSGQAGSCSRCGAELKRALAVSQPAMDQPGPGTIIKGTYRILHFAGEGGAGAVYVAEHIHLNSLVAIKTLFSKFVRDADMRRRFLEEAIIQANLNHPNIARVTDVVEEGNFSAIIMEYIEGSSLDKHIKTLSVPQPIETTLRLFAPILDGMAYAHAQGLVHRDIKPANILLTVSTDGMIPKITDFGIAKVLSDERRTETGTAMGTVYYASPEQLTDAKSVDHRADIYSLGCTLYELLTLKLPFEDSSMFGVMKMHLQAPRPDPRLLNPQIPSNVASAIMKAMAVNPDHRFQTCAEFAREVRAGLAAEALPGGAATLPPSFKPPTTKTATGARQDTTASGKPARTTRTGDKPAPRTQNPGSVQTPMRRRTTVVPAPAAQHNVIGIAIWVIIGLVAAIGIGIAVTHRKSPAPMDAEADARTVATDVSPEAEHAPEVVAVTAATTAATSAASAQSGPLDAARPLVERLRYCRELPGKYANFQVLGEVTLPTALAEVRAARAPCTTLMQDEAGSSQFDRTTALLNADYTEMVELSLSAQLRAASAGDVCPEALSAVTIAYRALRRIAEASSTDGYMDFEIQTFTRRRTDFRDLYQSITGKFNTCSFVSIPDDLLGLVPGRVVAPTGAAPTGAAPTAAANAPEIRPSDGSGHP